MGESNILHGAMIPRKVTFLDGLTGQSSGQSLDLVPFPQIRFQAPHKDHRSQNERCDEKREDEKIWKGRLCGSVSSSGCWSETVFVSFERRAR